MFFLIFMVFWAFAEPLNPSAIKQEEIPLLTGKISSLDVQNQEFINYFSGQSTVQNIFWNTSTESFLSIDFVKSKRLQIYAELTKITADRLKKLEIDEKDRRNPVFEEYQNLWNNYLDQQSHLYNQQLRFFDALYLGLQQYPQTESHQFQELQDSWNKQQKKLLNEDSPNSEMIVDILSEKQRVLDFYLEIIQYFTIVNYDLQPWILNELQDDSTSDIAIEARIERLNVLFTLSSDTQVQERLQQLVLLQRTRKLEVLQAEYDDVFAHWAPEKNASIEELSTQKDRLTLEMAALNIEDESEKIIFEIKKIQHDRIQAIIQVEELLQDNLQEELVESQQKLEEAKRLEQMANDETKKFREMLRELRETENIIRETESQRRSDIQEFIDQSKNAVEQLNLDMNLALQLPPMDPKRQDEIDSVYRSLQDWIQKVEEKIDAVYDIESSKQDVSIKILDNGNAELIQAQQDVLKAQKDSQDNLNMEMRVLYQNLIPLKKMRQSLNGDISTEAFEYGQQDFWSDVLFEWTHFPLIGRYHWDRFVEEVAPNKWTLQYIGRFFSKIFQWLFWIGVWYVGRQNALKIWRTMHHWLSKQQLSTLKMDGFDVLTLWEDDLPNSNKQKMQERLAPMIFDVCLWVGIFIFAEEGMYVTPIIYVITFVILWRTTLPFVSYLIEDQDLNTQLCKALNSFVIYIFGMGLFNFLLREWFFADRSGDLLALLQVTLLLLLVFLQLGTWSHFLQNYAKEVEDFPTIQRWIGLQSNSWLGKRLKSLLALVLLTFHYIQVSLFWMAERSSIVGGFLARSTLVAKQEREKHIDFMEYFPHFYHDALVLKYVDEVQDNIAQWQQEKRRGLLSIIGDEGMGKSAIVNELQKQRQDPVQIITIDGSVSNIVDIFADAFKQNFEDNDAVIAYLLKTSSQIIVLDDIQHLFLRDVSGYTKLRELLRIVQNSADTHFWILTCHVHTWNFLNSKATSIHLQIFRKVLKIQPWSVYKIRQYFTEQAQKNGYQLDFSTLSKLPQNQAIQRAEIAYWRLLTDASRGNPSIALKLWQQSLYEHSDKQLLIVKVFPLVNHQILNNLDDNTCFVLANILIHNRQSLKALHKSLQMSMDQVESICRYLESLNLIEMDTVEQYYINLISLPWVETVLLQKRMIGSGE